MLLLKIFALLWFCKADSLPLTVYLSENEICAAFLTETNSQLTQA